MATREDAMRPGLVVVLAASLAATPAAACQCYNFSRAEIVQRADIVFEGTVAVVTVARGQLQATVDVQRLEKGPDVPSVTLLTPASAAACGVAFQPFQRVIVAARRDGNLWRTDLCMALALRPAPFVPNR
jgi:hypothetical protein